MKYLVDKGAKLDLKNNAGKTALDLARDKNHNEIVKYLEEAMKNSKVE